MKESTNGRETSLFVLTLFIGVVESVEDDAPRF
jgi:hypothetical protein